MFFSSFIEDFYQKSGVDLTEDDLRVYEQDLYMSNLAEKDAYISQVKAAGFSDIQVGQFPNSSIVGQNRLPYLPKLGFINRPISWRKDDTNLPNIVEVLSALWYESMVSHFASLSAVHK